MTIDATQGEVRKVLLLLKNMVYESTSPLETLRFAKYYRKKGLDVVVVLWGPMGVLLGKAGKRHGAPKYDEKMWECLNIGVEFKCCRLGSDIIGVEESELIPGVTIIEAHEVAELFLRYTQPGHMIISL
ncbi:peroxiredoxin [Methanosarcinales archaeon ex4572_44]|nr:MAG: peroxiredoxin [Methanosarcinales archaeon ex4484_138]PHP45894.1 MAG: peroxiredoxin [Methanosarcinales archaeon ex4572_44]RLG26918.1 MAG: peroxiredoxin [Methanosarcinales archaeon]RLG27334.1 MAG: peroxiredoxin [Methanosarcinales archaeon]